MAQTIKPHDRIWKVVGYARLSNAAAEDGISPSVRLQRAQIERAVSAEPTMELVAFFEDDGWSGSSFDRPGFRRLEALLLSGAADCIVVRDLSRLGRNYLEMGNYLEHVLPELGVRLVALEDAYDSIASSGEENTLLVPLKNLMNDYYCITASAKTRQHLLAKRMQGANICAFAPYGYTRGPRSGHLVADEAAAPIVKEIFRMRLLGLGPSSIARMLNRGSIPTPQESKRLQGSRHYSPTVRSRPQWNARMVNRILANEVYTGTLVQGRRFKPSFRSGKVAKTPELMVTRIPNAHEALVSTGVFEQVGKLRKEARRG